MKGVYDHWHKVSPFITGQSNIQHKSFTTREEAQKAFEEYQIQQIQTETPYYKSKLLSTPSTSIRNSGKMTSIDKIPNSSILNIPTREEKQKTKQPSPSSFNECYSLLSHYSEKEMSQHFYPTVKLDSSPKAIFFPEANPLTLYKFFVHGLIDTIYLKGTNLLSEFPPGPSHAIMNYLSRIAKDKEGRDREIFIKIYSSFPEFSQKKLLVPSYAVMVLGISNMNYPPRDGPTKRKLSENEIEELNARYFAGILRNIGRIDTHEKYFINYRSENILIYSKYSQEISPEGIRAVQLYEGPFSNFSGPLQHLPYSTKELLCILLRSSKDSDFTDSISIIMEDNKKKEGKEGKNKEEKLKESNKEEIMASTSQKKM
ncbi:uncharacterized protein [Rutidosis leptorrhynchoides]|uniref:uncharacterized protein n=1 Tax=Rutidosis leptorrhynchoides TaxID=125765 RepID=UPI003A9998CB